MKENVHFSIVVEWERPINADGQPYSWGDRKSPAQGIDWQHNNIIYRWVKHSTQEIAHIGETERTISDRVNNYMSAKPDRSAEVTNKKLFNEQRRLANSNDFLYLEFTDNVAGYNLTNNRERKLAECLLIGFYRP